jgi:hypothetical protein
VKTTAKCEFDAPTVEFEHAAVILNVGKSLQAGKDVYAAAQRAWVLNCERACKAQIVLAVAGGMVVGVFRARDWVPVTPENFPGTKPEPKRWGFRGDEAPREVVDQYLFRRLPESMLKRGASNPVKYGCPNP